MERNNDIPNYVKYYDGKVKEVKGMVEDMITASEKEVKSTFQLQYSLLDSTFKGTFETVQKLLNDIDEELENRCKKCKGSKLWLSSREELFRIFDSGEFKKIVDIIIKDYNERGTGKMIIKWILAASGVIATILMSRYLG